MRRQAVRWTCAVLSLGFWWSAASRADILPNGSFETGGAAPEGWTPSGEVLWGRGDAFAGARSVSGAAAGGGTAWESAAFPLDAPDGFRLGGYVRCPEGEAGLTLTVMDDGGKVMRTVKTFTVTNTSHWQYVAAESPAVKGQAKVALWAKGQAAWDSVAVASLSWNLFVNSALTTDRRGRIGLLDA